MCSSRYGLLVLAFPAHHRLSRYVSQGAAQIYPRPCNLPVAFLILDSCQCLLGISIIVFLHRCVFQVRYMIANLMRHLIPEVTDVEQEESEDEDEF